MEVSSELIPPLAAIGGTIAVVDPNPRHAESLARILTRIQQQTHPTPLPKPWASLGATKSVYQLRGNPADLVASLQTEFSVEELLAARCRAHFGQ